MFSDFQHFSSKTAVCLSDSRQISYVELEQKVSKAQELLTSSEIIFIIGTNDLETLVCYIAAIRKGSVPLMLSPSLDHEYLRKLLENYNPKYIWVPSNFDFEFPLTFDKKCNLENYSLLSSDVVSNLPDTLALLLTTSGSTGNPKLVRISKDNLAANTASIIEALSIQNEDRLITTLPINYSYGLSMINTHLQKGAALVLNNFSVSSREFWEYAIASEATSMGGVPFTYEMFVKFKTDFISKTNLKKFTQAGGKLKKELALTLLETIEDLDATLQIMYGQTEATARISVLPFEEIRERPESIGKAIPLGEILLFDEDGVEIREPFHVGVLRYKGPNVSLGHAENLADLYREDANKGILDTGDLAYKDHEGYFYISGRKNRFVKIYGIRMSLDDIEEQLSVQNFQCVCVQLNDVLIVFTLDANQVSAIQNFLMQRFKLRSSDYFLRVVNSFPRSESGKVLYADLTKEVSFEIAN